jgi:hypothetical protein
MTLTVVWHKLLWRIPGRPESFASHRGVVRQIEALSELFEATRVVGACARPGGRPGQRVAAGHRISFACLTWLPIAPGLAWALLPIWLLRNGIALVGEVARADAVYPLLPSPVGLLGLILALALRKRLLVRPMNTWSEPKMLWRIERALLERIAGGRNVVFATGELPVPPSTNPAVRWLHSTTVSEEEMVPSQPRRLDSGSARLIAVGRQLEDAAADVILRSLPRLVHEHPRLTLDVVGHGRALPRLQSLARGTMADQHEADVLVCEDARSLDEGLKRVRGAKGPDESNGEGALRSHGSDIRRRRPCWHRESIWAHAILDHSQLARRHAMRLQMGPCVWEDRDYRAGNPVSPAFKPAH